MRGRSPVPAYHAVPAAIRLPLHEEQVPAVVLERRIALVEVLRVEEVVHGDAVVGVPPRRLRTAKRLRRLSERPHAEVLAPTDPLAVEVVRARARFQREAECVNKQRDSSPDRA